jgi:hypothetical protein
MGIAGWKGGWTWLDVAGTWLAGYSRLRWWPEVPGNAATKLSAMIPHQANLRAALYPQAPSSSLTAAAHPTLNWNLPTQFPGAFKPSFAIQGSANLDIPNLGSNPPGSPTLVRDNVAAGQLVREDLVGGGRVIAATDGRPHNPMVENYPVTRLSNLVTSNSHVYSVRIVLGYFEFDPFTGLGREYGEDEGKVKRHKAFYVIDRSVPVAFEEGVDHNTGDCILLRRIVE